MAKNRFDGQLGRFTLRFDKERLSFSRANATRDESDDPEQQQQSVPIEQ